MDERRIERFAEIAEGVLHAGEFEEFKHPRAAGGKFRVTTGGHVLNGYRKVGRVSKGRHGYIAYDAHGSALGGGNQGYDSKEEAGRRVLMAHLGETGGEARLNSVTSMRDDGTVYHHMPDGKGKPYPSEAEKEAYAKTGRGYSAPPGANLSPLKTAPSDRRSDDLVEDPDRFNPRKKK